MTIFDTRSDEPNAHPEESCLYGDDVWAADGYGWLTVGGPDGEVTGSELDWLHRVEAMFPGLADACKAERVRLVQASRRAA